MKTGINIWSFSGYNSTKECIDLAKKVGFNGLELALDEEGEISLNSRKNELLEIKKYSIEQGIHLHSLASGLYWKYSITSEDKTVREKL